MQSHIKPIYDESDFGICIVCNCSKFKVLHSEGQKKLIKCRSCGLCAVHSMPEFSFTDEEYKKMYLGSDTKTLLHNCEKRGRQIEQKYLSLGGIKGKVLDVGCASGAAIYALEKHGWDVYGIDPNSFLIGYGQKKFKLKNLKAGILEKESYEDDFFDLIIVNSVLQYVPDPVPFINLCYDKLKKGGILYISVPNLKSFERTPYSKKINVTDFYHYTSHNFNELYKRTKFNTIHFYSPFLGSIFGDSIFTKAFSKLGVGCSLVMYARK